MATRFAYYPGCIAEFSSKELDATTKHLAPMLDIELLPMPAATCCGAGDIAEAKPNLYLTLNVRILSQAEEMGVDILTICNVCTLNLRRANKMVKEDARLLEQVNEELVKVGARAYEGTSDVTHLLWYLSTEEGLSLLEKQGPRGLNGLRVAPYYGCQLLRPSSVMGFEDPDKPQSLERLITALGGEVADYEAKSSCCGFPIILARDRGGPEGVAPRAVAVARRRRRLHGHPVPALPPARWTPTSARPRRRTPPSTTCRCSTCPS